MWSLPARLPHLACFPRSLRRTLTHTSLPVLGQRVAAVALADEGAGHVDTELLTGVVLQGTQVLD